MREVLRAWAAVLAALLAAVAGPAGPAAADAAAPRWRPTGTPVTGAVDAGGAPELAPGHQYRDTVRAGEAKAYRVYLDAASTAYLSAFAIPAPGASVQPLDGLRLELKGSDDTLCDMYQAMFGAGDAARPVGGYVTRGAGTDAECRTAGWYVLWVTRNSQAGSDEAGWGLEIRFDAEPALIPGAAQPRPAVGYATAAPVPVTGAGRAVAGGSGMDDAATLREGVWKDAVRPGQTLFYKVRADWGQRIALVADFGAAGDAAGHLFGVSIARAEMYNPMRGYLAGDTAAYSGGQASAWLRTAPVAYGNRLDGRGAVAAARAAGWYYLAVGLDAGAADFVAGAVPLTLHVEVSGKAVAGPAYAGVASHGGQGAVGGASGTGRSATLRTVGFAALGTGVLLVLFLAGWTVAARRRKTVGAEP